MIQKNYICTYPPLNFRFHDDQVVYLPAGVHNYYQLNFKKLQFNGIEVGKVPSHMIGIARLIYSRLSFSLPFPYTTDK